MGNTIEFNYNDELLITTSDRKNAESNFPNVFFALDHEKLRLEFETIDKLANREKSKSQRWGFAGVGLATTALLTAAFEQAMHQHLPHDGVWAIVPKLIASLAACAGVSAVVIGYFGVLFRTNKLHWLQHRLITERIRQWHAQSLVGEIPAILAAARSNEEKTRFFKHRDAKFEEFKRHTILQVAAEFPRYITNPLRGTKTPLQNLVWIHDEWKDMVVDDDLDPDDPILNELFRAYKSIRLHGQIQYTSYKLRNDTGNFWTHAGVQARVMGNLAFNCIIGLLALHLLILVGIIGDIAWMNDSVIHALAISTAILALAGRTLEEGLHPHREVERHQNYLARLETAEQRFNEAKPILMKVAAMREVEEAAVAEMISFLTANYESKFVM